MHSKNISSFLFLFSILYILQVPLKKDIIMIFSTKGLNLILEIKVSVLNLMNSFVFPFGNIS